jgi:hypothetical protein
LSPGLPSRFKVAQNGRSTSCAIGCNAKSKDADIVSGRIVIKQARGRDVLAPEVLLEALLQLGGLFPQPRGEPGIIEVFGSVRQP